MCRDFVRNCRICIEKAPDCIEKHSGRYIKWVSSAEDTHSIMLKNMLEFLEVFESQFVEDACLDDSCPVFRRTEYEELCAGPEAELSAVFYC